LIKDTTLGKGRRLKQRIQEQQNEFISLGKVSRHLKQQNVDCLERVAIENFYNISIIQFYNCDQGRVDFQMPLALIKPKREGSFCEDLFLFLFMTEVSTNAKFKLKKYGTRPNFVQF